MLDRDRRARDGTGERRDGREPVHQELAKEILGELGVRGKGKFREKDE